MWWTMTPIHRCFFTSIFYTQLAERLEREIENGKITDERAIHSLRRMHLKNFDWLEQWQRKVGLEPATGAAPISMNEFTRWIGRKK
jgi:hypothetical protein